MSNCMFCWPNLVSNATLSGGNWTETLPLDNLKNSMLAKVARTSGVLESDTAWTITLPKAKFIRVLSLIRHNLDLNSKIKIDIWEDLEKTQLAYTSGLIPVWPRMYTTDELNWEDDNFWSCTLSEDELVNFPKLWLLVLDERVYGKVIDVTVSNETNEDGYLEFGTMFIAIDWQPNINISYGSAIQWVDISSVMTSENGTEHFKKKFKYRLLTGKLDYLEEKEAVNKVLHMQNDRGITEDIFFVWDPQDTTYLMQRSFIGRLETLNPVTAFMYNAFNHDFVLKEKT